MVCTLKAPMSRNSRVTSRNAARSLLRTEARRCATPRTSKPSGERSRKAARGSVYSSRMGWREYTPSGKAGRTGMKRIGVLGGISPQATMDFESRVHRVAQRLVPQHWNTGYPPMLVWYHRRLPIRRDDEGRPIVPMEVDPPLVEAAAVLGRAVDFLVITCNSAHVGLRAITAAASRPVLSMIDVTVDEIARRGWRRPGVMGSGGPPSGYVDPLEQRGLSCATLDTAGQTRLDSGIRAVMEGAEGVVERAAARDAVAALRGAGVDGVVLGCTEIPLLLGEASEAADLINPLALLAEATVRFATEDAPVAAAPGAR